MSLYVSWRLLYINNKLAKKKKDLDCKDLIAIERISKALKCF